MKFIIFLWSIFFSSILYAIPMNDKSGLSLTEVDQIIKISENSSIEVLQKVIREARKNNQKVTVYGSQHTQGGHIFYNQGIILNLSNLNNIQRLSQNIIRVQSGATWKQVIEFLNPLGLSVDIMQSDYDFSMGGTLSTNVHGWQVNKPPLIASIRGFHILMADGSVRYCNRQKNTDLFKSVIGGYGLLGVIIDVDLHVIHNHLYDLKQWVIKTEDFLPFFKKEVQGNKKAAMFFGRFSLDRKNFLRKIAFRIYEDTEQQAKNQKLSEHRWAQSILNWFFSKTRKSDFLKKVRWEIENNFLAERLFKSLSRNQLLYHSVDNYINTQEGYTDLLQEYFIPIENFEKFIFSLRSLEKDMSDYLMNITIRHVQKDNESLLNYAPQEMVCFVMFFRGPKTKDFDRKLSLMAQKMTDQALVLKGSYYLPYRPYQSKQQFEKAYPRWKEFKNIKLIYDSSEVFFNQFYENYFGEKLKQD